MYVTWDGWILRDLLAGDDGPATRDSDDAAQANKTQKMGNAA